MEGQKVRICEKYKGDFTYLKEKFTSILEEEASSFDVDPNEKNRFKTMGIEYLNLIMKVQKEVTEYVDSESSLSEEDEEDPDELFEEKNRLLQKALLRKVEQNRKTVPSQMSIDLEVGKPEQLFVARNGAEVPIESALDFTQVEQFPRKLQEVQERQHAYCNFSKELLAQKRWLIEKKN